MPTKLTEPLLRDALTRLNGWDGDAHMIHREFDLAGLPRQALLQDIESLAQSTDHTIMLTDTDRGLDVSLATTDVDGVSEVDIAMAARLNDLFLLATAVPAPRQAQGPTTVQPSMPEALGVTTAADQVEPLMGVPAAVVGGGAPAPLPDTAPGEPEPGIELQQETGERRHYLG